VLHADDTKFVLGVPTALPTTSATTSTANAKANEYLISNDIYNLYNGKWETLPSAVTTTKHREQAHPPPMGVGFASRESLSLIAPPALKTLGAASGTFAETPSVLEFSSLTVSSATSRAASNLVIYSTSAQLHNTHLISHIYVYVSVNKASHMIL